MNIKDKTVTIKSNSYDNTKNIFNGFNEYHNSFLKKNFEYNFQYNYVSAYDSPDDSSDDYSDNYSDDSSYNTLDNNNYNNEEYTDSEEYSDNEEYNNNCIKINSLETIDYGIFELYNNIKEENKKNYMEIGECLIKNLNKKKNENKIIISHILGCTENTCKFKVRWIGGGPGDCSIINTNGVKDLKVFREYIREQNLPINLFPREKYPLLDIPNKYEIKLIKNINKIKLYPIKNNISNIINIDIEKYYINIFDEKYYCESKMFSLYDKLGKENRKYFCLKIEENNIKLMLNIEIFEKYKGKSINDIPYELYLIFNNNKVDIYNKNNYIKDVINEKIEESCNEKINVDLFNHQKNNIKWIESIEMKVEENIFQMEYINKKKYYEIEHNNNIYYFKNDSCNNPLYDEEMLEKSNKLNKYNFRGGVLADEVGLGKTLTFITNILNNIEERTLIICPKRLVNQWYDEFKKYSKESLKNHLISIRTITDLKNKTKEDFEKYNIIIISYDFLKSNSYVEWCSSKMLNEYLNMIYLNVDKNTINSNEYDKKIKNIEKKYYKSTGKPLYYEIIDTPDKNNNIEKIPIITTKAYNTNCKYQSYNIIEDISYDRIIIDEFHELFSYNMNKNSIESLLLHDIIKKDIKYKWLISATPIINKNNVYNSYNIILNYLSCGNYKKDNITEKLGNEEYKWIKENIFRCNKKDKIHDIKIPNFEEENIFISLTKTERMIYDYIKKNDPNNIKRLMQICTHILVSSEESNILNFDMSQGIILSLNSINNIMTNDLKNKRNDLNKQINKSDIDIKTFDDICNKIKDYFILNNIVISNIEEINLEDNIDILNEINNESNLDNYDIEEIKKQYKRYKSKIYNRKKTIKTLENRIKTYNEDILKFENNYINDLLKEPCGICSDKIEDGILTECNHIFCYNCIDTLLNIYEQDKCPYCRKIIKKNKIKKLNINILKDEDKHIDDNDNNKYGSKMNYLIKNINKIIKERPDNKIILFSQWNSMLKLVGIVLNEYNIKYLECKGNIHMISKTIRKFKNDNNIKIILLSSENCVSGNNLTEASHIIMLDTMNSDKKKAHAIEHQAIGRAVRIGQKRKVKIQRLITIDTIEYEYFNKNFENVKKK